MQSIRRISALAHITFIEGIRDRALYGITIVALMMLCANILFTNLFGHEIGKVMVDLNLSTIAFAALLLTFFVNINLIAKDIDRRTIYCVLSKPLSRSEYIIGKYFGLIILVVVAILLLTICSSGVVWFVKKSVAIYFFRTFSWACYSQAVLYAILMFILLNAVVIFFSSISTSAFLTMLFSIATYIVGQSIEEVLLFFKNESATAGYSSKLNEVLLEYLQYFVPNFSAFDIKTMASHGQLMSMDHTLALIGYTILFSSLLIFFASLIFKRREFN